MNNQEKRPIISFIIPCYNCEKTLERAIDSIRNQLFSLIQIVLIDDGSTDGTAEICEKYTREDSRVKVIHQCNKGLMRAWKNGVLEAEGEYIAFCDADDYIDNDYASKVSVIIDKERPDLITCGIKIDYSNGKKERAVNRLKSGVYSRQAIENDIYPKLFSNGGMQSELVLKSRWSKVYRKDVLLKIMPDLPDAIAIGEDWITVFAIMLNVDKLVCANDIISYHYMRNTESMTGSHIDGVFDKIELLYDTILGLSEKYGYKYRNGILADKLSMYFVFMKKELQLNLDGYKGAVEILRQVTLSRGFQECKDNCSIDSYRFTNKWFGRKMIKQQFLLPFIVVQIAAKMHIK